MADLSGQLPSKGIVNIYDRFFILTGKLKKQPLLGLAIGIHGDMIVKVVPREVGENNRVKGAAPYPVLIEGMRGNLHDAMGRSGENHLRQQFLKIRRRRRRMRRAA